MKMRSGNPSVAIVANKSTIELRNAEAAGGSSEVSYAAVLASSPRITRSSRAEIIRVQGGNTDVAANTLAARGARSRRRHLSLRQEE